QHWQRVRLSGCEAGGVRLPNRLLLGDTRAQQTEPVCTRRRVCSPGRTAWSASVDNECLGRQSDGGLFDAPAPLAASLLDGDQDVTNVVPFAVGDGTGIGEALQLKK